MSRVSRLLNDGTRLVDQPDMPSPRRARAHAGRCALRVAELARGADVDLLRLRAVPPLVIMVHLKLPLLKVASGYR